MILDEAQALASRIRETWPHGGPSAKVWAEELEAMDAGRAGTTLARLRRSEDRCPSIHRFFETYMGVETEQSHPRDRPRCITCDGNRWVDAKNVRNSAVIPCPDCSAGAVKKPAPPDMPADNAYVDALLGEWARRHELDPATHNEPGWAQAFHDAWPGHRPTRTVLWNEDF